MSERKGRRGGGRAARQELRAQGNTETIPYLERQIPPMSVLDEASLVQLEENAEIIMSEVGIAFQEFPLALELFAEAGCTIEGDLVKFPKGLARKIVTDNAPATYIQHARNPERNVKIGGNSTVFAPNYGSPFVTDLDKRSSLRDHRRLPQYRQAHLYVAPPSPQRWNSLRAD